MSANLSGPEGVAKVTCNEQDARHEAMERVNHRKTDCIGAGEVQLRPERFFKDPVTDVAKEAELFNHRIGMVRTILNWPRMVCGRLRNVMES